MAHLRRAVVLLFAFAMAMCNSSCDGFWVSESSIQSVTVSPSAVLLQTGGTDTYTFSSAATTVGGTTTDDTATATWSSSDSTIAAAAGGGIVTEVTATEGKSATIKATDGSQSGTATVLTYTGTAPTTLNLGYTLPSGITPTTIQSNSSFPVTASASLNGNPSYSLTSYVTWSISNNTAGATIDSAGTVSVPSTAAASSTFTVNASLYFGAAASPATLSGSLNFNVSP